MGLTTKLLEKAARAAAKRASDALSPDRLLQLGMEGLIEAARTRHESEPMAPWRPGEPLRLLLAGYVGSRNTGADVRTEEMIKQFRHVLGDEHVDLTILTIDPELTRGYFRTVKQLEIPQIFPKFLYDQVRRYHGVIACEGSMFKSKFASALTTMMVGALGLAVAEEKLAVGYGGEAGAMDPTLEKLVRESIGQGALVIARNEESQGVLADLGVPSRPGTDTAWTFEPGPQAKERARLLLERAGWDGEMPLAIVCPINPFWWPVKPDAIKAAIHSLSGAYERSHFKSVYFHEDGPEVERKLTRYLGAMAGAMGDLARERDVFPVVVAMEALDARACERVADLIEQMPRKDGQRPLRPPVFLSAEHDMFTMVALLREASVILSSRYHALVCSMPAGVPSVGVTMDERIRNLMRDRAQPELCLEVDDESLDVRALEAMRRCLDDASQVRRGIERSVATNLVRMGEMGISLLRHVRTHHPRFPVGAHLDESDPISFLPPLAAPQRALIEAHRASHELRASEGGVRA